MAATCKQCSLPVIGLDNMKCHGFCSQLVHLKCIGWKRPNMDFVNQNDNLLWLCNDCLNILDCVKANGTIPAVQEVFAKAVEQSLQQVSSQINDIKTAIMSIQGTSSTAAPQAWPALKRARAEVDRSPRVKHSGELMVGTKLLDSTSKLIRTVPKPEAKFWLYLSRIDPGVSEDDVITLVQECLKCDDTIVVRKLLKKDADLASLQFISFKVGLNIKYKNAALNTSTWPSGILFREFEDLRQPQFFGKPAALKIPRIDVNITPVKPRADLPPQSAHLAKMS